MAVLHRHQLDSLLRQKTSRDNALSDVRRLYKLFPKGALAVDRDIDFSKPPKEYTVPITDHHTFRRDALLANFLKKFRGFSAGNPREVAKKNFLFYEDRCKESNSRIRKLREDGSVDPSLQAVLFTAQRKISGVLGDFDIDELLRLSRWGPGSTSSCKGPLVDAAQKFSSEPQVTGEFLARARLLMPLYPSWSALLADTDYGAIVNPIMPLVKGNKIAFVPKTAKTHRVIAIEPHINVFFQNGLGRMIRKRMRLRARVDLNDQTLNQRLARLGSLDDSLATIDLEGASDTICRELVRDLLPEDWFSWLDSARSHVGSLDGEFIRYQKFSSMGNGATFDLESLIFWALSSAVVERLGYNSFWVNVFGDDIVIPSGAYDEVVRVLESVGFIVNKAKSFCKGPFRESCGLDWFSGFNVRPVYLKEIPLRPIDWIVIANQLRRLSHEWGERQFCHSDLKTAYEFCLSRIPKELRSFKVPLGYDFRRNSLGGFEGNGLLANFDEANPSISDRGWCGWTVRGFAPRAITLLSKDRHLLTASAHTVRETGNELSLRERFDFREVPRPGMFIPQPWYQLGPWGR